MFRVRNSRFQLGLAACAAVISHLFVFALSPLNIQTPLSAELSPISIQLTTTETPSNELPEPPINSNEPDSSREQFVQASDLIAKSPDQVQPNQTTTRLQTNITSSSFKSFLKSETQLHSDQNEPSIQAFSNTFEEVYQADTSATEISSDMLPVGTGVFMARVNGQRRCGAQVVQMLSGDGLGGDTQGGFLTRDCTPPKKFILDMNKPNNGSMSR